MVLSDGTVRHRLAAPAQGEQHAVGDVAGREAGAGRLGAVHAHLEVRVVEVLLDAQVGQAGHVTQLGQDPVGHLPVALEVVALDLHVDRGGQAEVQDLGHDVGRQEVEGDPGELLGQARPQVAHVIRGGPVLFLRETRMSASPRR